MQPVRHDLVLRAAFSAESAATAARPKSEPPCFIPLFDVGHHARVARPCCSSCGHGRDAYDAKAVLGGGCTGPTWLGLGVGLGLHGVGVRGLGIGLGIGL
jgi:hypothetical protein